MAPKCPTFESSQQTHSSVPHLSFCLDPSPGRAPLPHQPPPQPPPPQVLCRGVQTKPTSHTPWRPDGSPFGCVSSLSTLRASELIRKTPRLRSQVFLAPWPARTFVSDPRGVKRYPSTSHPTPQCLPAPDFSLKAEQEQVPDIFPKLFSLECLWQQGSHPFLRQLGMDCSLG